MSGTNVLTRFRPRLSYANVVATAAVFLSLAGGAYAALGAYRTDVVSKVGLENTPSFAYPLASPPKVHSSAST